MPDGNSSRSVGGSHCTGNFHLVLESVGHAMHLAELFADLERNAPV
jgi:hypothetical protein